MMFDLTDAMSSKASISEQKSSGANPTAPAAASSSSSAAAAAKPDLLLTSLPHPQVNAWLDHTAHCFSTKKPYPPSRRYFELHLQKDPMADLHGVAVVQTKPVQSDDMDTEEEAVAEKHPMQLVGRTAEQAAAEEAAAAEKKRAAEAFRNADQVIASAARVFVRRQFLQGKHITFGGIGEVCTRPEFRGQGFGELCVQRCMRYIQLLRMQLGCLHAAPEFLPFYQKQGFQSVERWFGVKSDFEAESEANIVGEGRKHGAFSLRLMSPAQFFDPNMLPQFISLYNSYSSGFNGPVVRSEEYWDSWVRSNIESSIGQNNMFPIEIYAAFEEWDGSDPAPNPPSPIRFLAYMFLQRIPLPDNGGPKRDRQYVVREYAVAPQWSTQHADGGRLMFLSLLQYAVRQTRHKFAEQDPAAAAHSTFALKFPLPLVKGFKKPLKMDWEEKDEGFLYQPFPLRMDAPVVEESTSSERREFRGKLLEEGPLTSPFAASPFVLHHDSEAMTDSSAQEMFTQIKQDAKNKFVFWGTDSF